MSDPIGEKLIRATGLTKTYSLGKRTIEVLRGVDFEIARGEFVALRGASGAGKSTLLHILGGLDLPNRGDIWFENQNLLRLSARDLDRFRNRKVGLIFQSYHLLPELDAVENVALPARMARVKAELAAEKAKQLLVRVGLGHRLDHKPYEMSGGEQQRVALARALINDPELILADEPTGNLDSKTGKEIIDLFCSLWRERKSTLIIATHDDHVAALAPRMIELVDGRVQHNDLAREGGG